MFKYKSSGEIVGIIAVIALAFSFVVFCLFATIKFYNTPNSPKAPTPLEKATQACIDRGGIPIIESRTIAGVNGSYPEDYLERCDTK